MHQIGGVELGKGGMGTVHTPDDLANHVPLDYPAEVHYVELGTGRLLVNRSDVGTVIRGLEAEKAVVKFRNFDMPPDVDDELAGNVELLQRIARHMKTSKTSATVVERTSPFLVVGRKYFLAGFTLGEISFPVYRHMQGDLSDFYQRFGDTVTAQHVLSIIMSTLYMLKEMAAVHAYHTDIKSPNILYDIECPVKSRGDAAALRRIGGCNVRFSLTDFGLVMFDHRRSDIGYRGTPGYMSPLLFDTFDEFERDYRPIMALSSLKNPRTLWNTYKGSRLTPAATWQKNDLYALGMMLMFFDFSDARTEPIRRFARALVVGPSAKESILTIDRAIDAYRKVHASLSKIERRLDIRTYAHIVDSYGEPQWHEWAPGSWGSRSRSQSKSGRARTLSTLK